MTVIHHVHCFDSSIPIIPLHTCLSVVIIRPFGHSYQSLVNIFNFFQLFIFCYVLSLCLYKAKLRLSSKYVSRQTLLQYVQHQSFTYFTTSGVTISRFQCIGFLVMLYIVIEGCFFGKYFKIIFKLKYSLFSLLLTNVLVTLKQF